MTDMKIENRKINRSASENDKQHKKSFAIETEAFNSPDHTLARLNSSRQGLTTEDALERLNEYGRNEVAHEQAPPALIQLLQAFNNPFIYVLMALAAVSFVTDYWLPLRNGEETDLTGIIIIVTMVSLSGLLRFWQEFRTNKAAQALKSMVRRRCCVAVLVTWGRRRRRLPLRNWCPVTSSSWRRGIWFRRMSACWSPGTCSSASRYLAANRYRWKSMMFWPACPAKGATGFPSRTKIKACWRWAISV